MFAFIARSPFYQNNTVDCGDYNGYIAFKEDLPKSYMSATDIELQQDIPLLDYLVEVHGGITFDDQWDKETPIIPLTSIPENYYEYRVIGFDCAHLYDTRENCPFEFVKAETFKLKEQIEKLIEAKP